MKKQKDILEAKPLDKSGKIKNWWDNSIIKAGIKSVKVIFKHLN